MSPVDPALAPLLVLILTCDRSPPERLVSAHGQLTTPGRALDVRVINGHLAGDPVVDELHDPGSARWRTKRPMSRTEVAIYAGHRRAWQTLLDSDAPFALFLEDDFTVADAQRFVSVLRGAQSLLSDGRHVVKLFDFEKQRPTMAAMSRVIADVEIVRWQSPTAGMVAYLISREGARRFLRRKRIFRPVDEDLKYWWELGLDVWSVPGNPVVEASAQLGGSLVEADREQMRSRTFGRSLWGNLLTLDRKLRNSLHMASAKRRAAWR